MQHTCLHHICNRACATCSNAPAILGDSGKVDARVRPTVSIVLPRDDDDEDDDDEDVRGGEDSWKHEEEWEWEAAEELLSC